MESKNMESSISKSLKRKRSSDEIFDFPTLPYVCQRRFAEICDPITLETFSSINLGTRNLSKRCHIIKNVEIPYGIDAPMCKYSVSCFCKENEFCKGIIDENVLQVILSKNVVQEMDKSSNSETFKIIFGENVKKELRQNLMVFVDETKIFGYIFTWNKTKKAFYCQECSKLKCRANAKIIQNVTGEEYLEYDKNGHVCNPVLVSNTIVMGKIHNNNFKHIHFRSMRISHLNFFK